MAGVPFFRRGDIDQVRLRISANSAKYGFTTISNAAANAACTVPTGITTAWALLCSSDASAPSTWVSATAPQTNLFADDQHLATAGQKLMGNYLFGLIVPPNATHDFNGDGKSDIALARQQRHGGAVADERRADHHRPAVSARCRRAGRSSGSATSTATASTTGSGATAPPALWRSG